MMSYHVTCIEYHARHGFHSRVSKSEHLKNISKAIDYHVVCSLFANTILNRLGFGMFTMVTAIFHCLSSIASVD